MFYENSMQKIWDFKYVITSLCIDHIVEFMTLNLKYAVIFLKLSSQIDKV